MKDFKLTFSRLGYFIQEATKLLQESPNQAFRVNIVRWREKRSLSQNAFQHVIYEEISKYLVSKGRKDWTPGFTKENMKNTFLGWVDEEFTNMQTGEIVTKSVLRSTSKLDLGEAYNYTTQILDWANSIGCFIKIPESSEYYQLMQDQNQ